MPKLSQNDFNGATLAGTQALIITLSDEIAVSSPTEGQTTVAKFPRLLGQTFLTAGITIGFTAICIYLDHLYRRYGNSWKRQAPQSLRKYVAPATVDERGRTVFLDLLLLAIVYGVVAFLTARAYKAPLVLANTYIPRPIVIALICGNLEGAFDLGFLTGWSGFVALLGSWLPEYE